MSLSAVPRPAPPTLPAARRRRHDRRALGLLVALTVGALVAIGWALAGGLLNPHPAGPVPPGLASGPVASAASVPAGRTGVETHPASEVSARAPAPVTQGVVLASSSCLDAGAHDLVAVRTPDGVARRMPLDACGNTVGAIVPLQLDAGAAVAHLAGTGSAGRDSGDAPMARRLAVTLTAVAALGTAGLVVAVGRDRFGRGRAGSASRRPAGGATGR